MGGGVLLGGQGGCDRRIEVFVKIQKINSGGWDGGGGGGVGLGGQGGCEQRFEASGKIQKKNWWGGRGRVWAGGRGGCDRRIEVFVKIQKKKNIFWGEVWGRGSSWGGGGAVRVDVNEELKFL